MKVFQGKVISTKMPRTATVAVERVVTHPMYKKRYKRIKKYHVQDDFGVAVGEVVKFSPSRPISKLKKWRIIGIIDKKGGKRQKPSS